MGIPFVGATARTPRAVRKIVGHRVLGRVACANGAVVWDAERDEVIREVGFEPATLSGAIADFREAVPGVAFALLSARTMFADEAYVALRRKRTAGGELFSDVSQVLA